MGVLSQLVQTYDRVYLLIEADTQRTAEYAAVLGPQKQVEKLVLELCTATRHVIVLHTSHEQASAFVLHQYVLPPSSSSPPFISLHLSRSHLCVVPLRLVVEEAKSGGPLTLPPAVPTPAERSALAFLTAVPAISFVAAHSLLRRSLHLLLSMSEPN
jgi:hypothetical protein